MRFFNGQLIVATRLCWTLYAFGENVDWTAPLVQDADAIRGIVPISNVDHAEVQFYLEIGRAILVAPTLERELTDDELRSINKKSNYWMFCIVFI